MTIDNKDMIDIAKDDNQDQALKESLHEHGVKVSVQLHLAPELLNCIWQS